MALVLCTGVEEELLATRKFILENAGHKVITVTNERELTAACKEYLFDVAVIGQGVAPRIKKILASIIRQQCPSAKILELYPAYESRTLEDADSWLRVPTKIPSELAERVNELAKEPERRESA